MASPPNSSIGGAVVQRLSKQTVLLSSGSCTVMFGARQSMQVASLGQTRHALSTVPTSMQQAL